MMQGIQTLGPGVADKMAAMGQFEDDQIAHVAEGEVIVPAPILKYYPEVKDQVFAAIRDQGLEPEQFIVGNEMVAINPNTGVQEFGFFKKLFKKIKKVVKKAAPLLLAAALPGVGTFLAAKGGMLGMLGKGIGTLTAGKAGLLGTSAALDTAFKGGNLKDVLKAGATGAAVGGITQGISNQITGESGGYFTPATPAPTTSSTSVTPAATPESTASSSVAPAATPAKGIVSVQQPQVQPASFTPANSGLDFTPDPNAIFDETTGQFLTDSAASSGSSARALADVATDANKLMEKGFSPDRALNIAQNKGGVPGFTDKVVQEFSNNPLGATGTALSTASMAAPLFMSEEMPEQPSMTLNQEELAALLNQGDILNYQGRTIEGMYYNPETESFQDVPYVRSSGIMAAAAGGHIMGPGTGTSDSIPAYLSDGEFVMTADAVKGAGNGSRKKGAAKMYAMMNRFEGQA